MPPVRDEPVMILCGGHGTRLREITERMPKPMVDIGGMPILWHIMKLYSHHGYRRFILCLGYKSWQIKEWFLRYIEMQADLTIRLGADPSTTVHGSHELDFDDWEITLAETGLHSGTGHRVRLGSRYVDTDRFLLTYGDGIGDIDITELVATHERLGRTGTLTGVLPPARYGEIRVEGERIYQFMEKPPASDGHVNGGFFVFERDFVDYLPVDEPGHMFEGGPLRKLADDGELSIYRHNGFWMGMDTPREYTALNQLWDQGQAPWNVWTA
jgi:glucose-1-phosphate cytidylyltransferase